MTGHKVKVIDLAVGRKWIGYIGWGAPFRSHGVNGHLEGERSLGDENSPMVINHFTSPGSWDDPPSTLPETNSKFAPVSAFPLGSKFANFQGQTCW